MAKIQIKSGKLTAFGGIFPVMEKFEPVSNTNDDKRAFGNMQSYIALD